MADRYLCQPVVLYILGIVAAKGVSAYEKAGTCRLVLPVFAVLTAALSVWGFVRRQPTARRKLRTAGLLLVAFCTGVMRLNAVSQALRLQSAGITDSQTVSVQGRITKKQAREQQPVQLQQHQYGVQQPHQAGNQAVSWTVWLADSYLNTSQGIRFCGNLIVYTDLTSGEPVIGNTIIITGKTKLWNEARNEGSFDERAYYENQGYALKIYADKDKYQVVNDDTSRLQECLYRLQQKLVQVYKQTMREEEAGTLCAMLLGEKTLLSKETKELYQRSGIAHILAISGLHISILGAAAFGLLRKMGQSYPAAAFGSMGLLLLFGAMVGMSVSTARAVVMFGIYLGAACCGRAYDSANALAAAAAWILLENPRSLFLAGFQFSFAAVGGVLLGKEICRIYKPRFKLSETVLISLSMQMLTLPLTAWYYYEIPVYAVLLNLFVLPLMGVVLLTGLFGGAFGCLAYGGHLAFLALPAKGLLNVCSLLLSGFSAAGKLCLKLPGALYATGQPRIWQMVGYIIVLFVCICMLAGLGHSQIRAAKKAAGVCAAVCMGLLLIRIPKQAQTVILDVGQGDGIYIHTGDGMDVMIDGGSSDVKQVGAYRILPFLKSQGVAAVDCWFLSHLDKDHISGFTEIAGSGYVIREVVLAEGIVKDEAYERVMELLLEQQIPVRHLKTGEALKTETASFTCLAPDSSGFSNDRNASSLVLLYEDEGFRGFFSGDISKKEEQKLLLKHKLLPVAFYKAAHHGSKHSNAQELLMQLKPLVSAVSCAKENDYGHPGEEAVFHMRTYSGSVKYTMNAGQIRIWVKEGGIEIQEFCTKPEADG